MSPTRRDILKLAAGLGLTAAVPTAAERIAAAETLNQRVSKSPVLDPGTFARDARNAAAGGFGNDWYCAIHAEEYAELLEKERLLLDAMPELRNARFDHPFVRFKEAYFNFTGTAYHTGLQHGATFEHLRREVIGDLSQCRTCWGVGLTDQGYSCTSCGGTGIVATGAQIGRIGGGD